jgi:Predicted membrane protein (DUF2232)
MRAIAKFAMRSPTAASLNAAAYAIFALFFAPFMVVSGAIIGLSTLRFGARGGTRVFVVAILLGGLGYYLLLRQPAAGLLLCLTWLPTLLVGQVLRVSESQGLAMTACAVIAAIYAALVRVLVPDVTAHWQARLQALGETVRGQGGTFFGTNDIAVLAAVMHEATIVVVCLYWMTTILLARWWQAELYNPGGFGVEFRQLLIPRVVSPIAALIAVFALVQLSSNGIRGLPSDLLIVLVVLFSFQGLALLHHRVHKLGLAKWWLVGFYGLLILMPHRVGLILAFIGIADTLVDIRRVRSVK